MEEKLIAQGWTMYYECPTCQGKKGGTKQYYNHPAKTGYAIVIRPVKNTFRIDLNNRIIAGPFWGFELETKLTQYGL